MANPILAATAAGNVQFRTHPSEPRADGLCAAIVLGIIGANILFIAMKT
jgi:hypothetical protein